MPGGQRAGLLRRQHPSHQPVDPVYSDFPPGRPEKLGGPARPGRGYHAALIVGRAAVRLVATRAPIAATKPTLCCSSSPSEPLFFQIRIV